MRLLSNWRRSHTFLPQARPLAQRLAWTGGLSPSLVTGTTATPFMARTAHGPLLAPRPGRGRPPVLKEFSSDEAAPGGSLDQDGDRVVESAAGAARLPSRRGGAPAISDGLSRLSLTGDALLTARQDEGARILEIDNGGVATYEAASAACVPPPGAVSPRRSRSSEEGSASRTGPAVPTSRTLPTWWRSPSPRATWRRPPRRLHWRSRRMGPPGVLCSGQGLAPRSGVGYRAHGTGLEPACDTPAPRGLGGADLSRGLRWPRLLGPRAFQAADTPSPLIKSVPIKSPWVKLSGRPPIKFNGHENSHL